MSEVKKSENKRENQPATQAEPEYDMHTLRKHCMKLFGITTSTFDGAFMGHNEPMTVRSAKAILKKWKKEEIKK